MKKQVEETYTELALEFKRNKCIKAYTKLYNKMTPNLKNYVFGILKDQDQSDDVVLETMAKIYTRIDEYNPEWQITTWAYNIAKNHALHVLRQKSKQTSLTIYEDFGSEVVDGGNSVSSTMYNLLSESFEEKSQLQELLREDERLQKKHDILLKEIERLKPIYKDIFKDKFINNLSYKDIEIKHNQPYLNQFSKLQKQSKEAKLSGNITLYNKLQKEISSFKKKNIISEQTIKNRIHIGRKLIIDKLNLYDVFIEDKYKKNIDEND